MSHILLPVPFVPILQKEYADILQIQFNKAVPSTSPFLRIKKLDV
jgi:hypothetical protein